MKRRNFIKGFSLFGLFGLTASSIPDAIKPIIKSDTDQFCEFFHKFNGFPINSHQLDVYENIKKGHNNLMIPRQRGMTTFALTYTAWRSMKGDRVIFASRDHFNVTRNKNTYFNNCKRANIDPKDVDLFVAQNNRDNVCGRTYDTGIYDCSGLPQYDWWMNVKPCIKGDKIILDTYENV
jgi:hypothetical protein